MKERKSSLADMRLDGKIDEEIYRIKILDAAEKLSEHPTGHPLVDDEFLRSVGLHE